MRKDPLEAERDFRERIERAAESRRQQQRSHQPLRMLALPFKLPRLTLVLVILVGLGSFLVFIFGVVTKWTDAYACSLDEAHFQYDDEKVRYMLETHEFRSVLRML